MYAVIAPVCLMLLKLLARTSCCACPSGTLFEPLAVKRSGQIKDDITQRLGCLVAQVQMAQIRHISRKKK